MRVFYRHVCGRLYCWSIVVFLAYVGLFCLSVVLAAVGGGRVLCRGSCFFQRGNRARVFVCFFI